MALQPPQLLSNFAYRFNELPASRKIGLGVALAASIALIIGLFLWSSTPEYRVLFSNLSDKDAGAVTAALQQANVPYKTEANGTLLVPADQVYDLRFRLASQGLPKGGGVGFELMDSPKLGMTQFQEQLAFQRGATDDVDRVLGRELLVLVYPFIGDDGRVEQGKIAFNLHTNPFLVNVERGTNCRKRR